MSSATGSTWKPLAYGHAVDDADEDSDIDRTQTQGHFEAPATLQDVTQLYFSPDGRLLTRSCLSYGQMIWAKGLDGDVSY